eukprot:CAMPEP_0178425924 /NCGR_PEP_ID=MMETSP0689_2-20121128/28972_1 /TAXON_ID=160604 /ORGANISM="Amphidinium massartii, Strain CS-259" /LENGTH=539 /DNA_ID=CAMNT_0020047599 /DNA_START=29 /DNA_END=1648 /DNA_ORIENTATION=+
MVGRLTLAAALLCSLVRSVIAAECHQSGDALCSSDVAPEGGDIFIQNLMKKGHLNLAPHTSPGEKKKKFASMLASEMTDLVATKGKSGLEPEEVEHIKTIKSLIMENIIPSIQDGVAESRAELQELYDAVVECADDLRPKLQDIQKTAEEVQEDLLAHNKCREGETELLEEKEEACKELEKAQRGVHAPELDFEISIDISDAEMLQYLQVMDEHFCGRWKDYEEIWEKCDTLTDNHTDTRDKCRELQDEFESGFCEVKSALEQTCEDFDECWTSAVQRFNERKAAIEELQDSRLEEYNAAILVNCLWDAWDWEAEPCTVNETKVEECKEDLHPNATNVSLDIPELPTPPECDTSIVEEGPCSKEFLNERYGKADVGDAVMQDIVETCTECPEVPDFSGTPGTSLPLTFGQKAVATSLSNLMRSSGNMFVKTRGAPGKCDGVVTGLSAASVEVGVLQARSKVEMELAGHKMTLENDVATANGQSVIFAAAKDQLGIAVENGQVLFTKSGVAFSRAPASFTVGTGKVAVCTQGASVNVKFA